MRQRYVSKELTHFIGASRRPNEEAQYQLLRQILLTGILKNPKFDGGFAFSLSNVANDAGESLTAPVVCFCDIPIGDLQIHSEKYGRFGIAFRKEFLSGKGATPVFYVAKNSPTLPVYCNLFEYDRPAHNSGPRRLRPAALEQKMRFDLFEFWKNAQTNLYYEVISAPSSNPVYEFMQGPWWADYFEFLSLYIFGYVKYMDVGLPDEDSRNFYMEREWRMLGDVAFRIDDVVRVLLPEAFSQTFRVDFPEYFGQVSFIEG